MTTIRDYAKDHRVSYEAIRSQISRYRGDLDGHIVTKGRTKYLDDFAVEFLNSRRKDDPVSVVALDRSELVDSLRDQIDALKNELMTTQKRVIELQSENQLMIAAKTKYDLLVESSAGKDALIETLREDLKDARSAEETAKRETDAAKLDAERARDDLKSARADADQIRKQADEAREKSEMLKKERDAAAKEAKSYRKSIFGFYRKIKE